MIIIAGPYRSGTGDDPKKLAANVHFMESFALPIFRMGHIPVLGEWYALPLLGLAGSKRIGDETYEEIFHPIAERLLEKCDAVLRVGGGDPGGGTGRVQHEDEQGDDEGTGECPVEFVVGEEDFRTDQGDDDSTECSTSGTHQIKRRQVPRFRLTPHEFTVTEHAEIGRAHV